jgi:hypothetical protein
VLLERCALLVYLLQRHVMAGTQRDAPLLRSHPREREQS